MGATNRSTLVKCKDCSTEWSKRSDTLKAWLGRCRSCTQKHVKGQAKNRLLASVRARKQVIAQGGIPNARKFLPNQPKENHHQWKGGKPLCFDCKQRLSGYSAKRCATCVKKQRGGANHPSWKGGITPENKRIRNSAEYKQWRMKVLQRDWFTCVKCGYRSKKAGNRLSDIRADHIKPFSLFPELRFSVPNGRTLCVSCDKVFGFHYNRDFHKN